MCKKWKRKKREKGKGRKLFSLEIRGKFSLQNNADPCSHKDFTIFLCKYQKIHLQKRVNVHKQKDAYLNMKPCKLSAACHVPKGLLAKGLLGNGKVGAGALFFRNFLTFISQNFDTSTAAPSIPHVSSIFIEQTVCIQTY